MTIPAQRKFKDLEASRGFIILARDPHSSEPVTVQIQGVEVSKWRRLSRGKEGLWEQVSEE